VYPGPLIYEVGQVLARERPDALSDAAANLTLSDQAYLWIGAASAKMRSSVGMWDRLNHYLQAPSAKQWLCRAEDAATAVETAENGHTRGDSPEDDPDDLKQSDRKAHAAMDCAAAYANMVVLAGEMLTRRRQAWVKRAFGALRRVKDPYHRLPMTLDIALSLVDPEPNLCRREATRAIKMLPELVRHWSGIDRLTETLEQERNSAPQIAIRRQAWEGILNLASLVPSSHYRLNERPLIEDHTELFALAAYWITKLGGHVPESFWKRAEEAIETKFASVDIELKGFKEFEEKRLNGVLNQVRTLSMAAHALSNRPPMARGLDRLADNKQVLITAFRYFPHLPEDADCWNFLVGRIRGLDALEAAARRAGSHPSSVTLFPLLKQYPPSPHRSTILQILLDSIDDAALLVPLVDVAIDYPRDLDSWAASFVRLCGDNVRDWHAITDEILELRKLSTSAPA
jgi:hypothetical protein